MILESRVSWRYRLGLKINSYPSHRLQEGSHCSYQFITNNLLFIFDYRKKSLKTRILLMFFFLPAVLHVTVLGGRIGIKYFH